MPDRSVRRYPRSARVNRLLQEVLAEELERLSDSDPRLRLITVTGVEAEPDLRHATVLFSSLTDEAREALDEDRKKLQSSIARQARFKRTPLLSFREDPAIQTGQRVEDILRSAAQTPIRDVDDDA